MGDYPESYKPQETCFNCADQYDIGYRHLKVCKIHDVIVTVWAKCKDYDRVEEMF